MKSYRKRLGTTSSSNPKCHAEAFPIKASDHPEVIPSGSESQMPGGATAKGAFLQPQAC
jgi:hypothetical protein